MMYCMQWHFCACPLPALLSPARPGLIAFPFVCSWAGLFAVGPLVKLVPTVASTATMILMMERFSHPLVLPAVLALINLSFWAVLLAAGIPMSAAIDGGWVMKPAVRGRPAGGCRALPAGLPALLVGLGWQQTLAVCSRACRGLSSLSHLRLSHLPPLLPPQESSVMFWELWGLFNIHGLSLSGINAQAALLQVGKVSSVGRTCPFPWCPAHEAEQQQGRGRGAGAASRRRRLAAGIPLAPPMQPTPLGGAAQLAGLFLVVCFGSCMDIAAIQQDMPSKIDFDHELNCVGGRPAQIRNAAQRRVAPL